MTASAASRSEGLPAALQAKARRARRAMALERAVKAFWHLWPLAALAVAVAMSGIWPALPFWAQAAGGGALGAGALWAVVRGARRYRRPTMREAIRALDAEIYLRPVEALNDRLGDDADPQARLLWEAHRRSMRERAAAAEAPKADLSLARQDPWNLRYVAILLLFLGVLASRTEIDDTLAAALAGNGQTAPAPEPTVIEAWASPPDYTGAPPIYLTEIEEDSPIALPEGSRVVARIFNAPGGAALRAEGLTEAAIEVVAEDETTHAVEFDLTEDGDFAFGPKDAAPLGAWRLIASPDLPPTARLTEPPRPGEKSALTFSYQIEDDYGVASALATIELDPEPDPEAQTLGETIEFDVPVGYGGRTLVEETVSEDLIEHPWAGRQVRLRLTAMDAGGREAEVVSEPFILPARIFSEPMAKAFAEQRGMLAADIRDALDVNEMLDAATVYPDSYFNDFAAGIAASMAKHRLNYAIEENRELEAREGVMELLWTAALALEEGNLDDLREQYDNARRRLEEAMREGASQEELDRLTQEMQQALREYMRALAEQAQNNQGGQQQPQEGESLSFDQNDLDEIMRQLREAQRNGDTDRALELMALLEEMTRNMEMAQQGQGSGDGFDMGQQQNQPGQQQRDALQEMMRRQQELADEAFREEQRRQEQQQGGGQQSQPGQENQDGEGGGDTQDLARRQESLREGLEGLRGDMPDLSENAPGANGEEGEDGQQAGAADALEQADRAMGDAVEQLRDGEPGDAVGDQLRALEGMREALRSLGEMGERQAGQQEGGEEQAREVGRDPFGREVGGDVGLYSGENPEVPEQSARSRARGIEQELRRRSGERERPRFELDYIERLMRRFQ